MENSETIKQRFNRTSGFYDYMDRMIDDKKRTQALSLVKGNVLEVGVGTGKNLSFYPPGTNLTGIDFSLGMLNKARAKVEKLDLPINVSLLEMDAQNMSFEDNTFDTVVATCVFCSVPDPVKGLSEVKRVCKADGQIILLEHMRSNNPIIGKIMDIINPLTLYLIGSNINRKTMENLEKANIKVESHENLLGEIFKLIKAKP